MPAPVLNDQFCLEGVLACAGCGALYQASSSPRPCYLHLGRRAGNCSPSALARRRVEAMVLRELRRLPLRWRKEFRPKGRTKAVQMLAEWADSTVRETLACEFRQALQEQVPRDLALRRLRAELTHSLLERVSVSSGPGGDKLHLQGLPADDPRTGPRDPLQATRGVLEAHLSEQNFGARAS